MNKWTKSIRSVLAPPVCVLCGAAGAEGLDLCQPCRRELLPLGLACGRCARPLMDGARALCGQCQIRPPAFEYCQALYAYRTPVDHLLQRLKFGGRLELAHLLGQLMADWLAEDLGVGLETPLPERLLPVPLHAERLHERGFNQALELARPVARRLGIPLDAASCRRVRSTAMQADLSRAARLKNVRGAFEVVQPVAGHMAVIDDVMTTGSTAHELAQALLRAGAERVEVWVCARA